MNEWVDGMKDAWWLVLILPIKLVWRQVWRMVIFATRPDLFDRVNQSYEREHTLRIQTEAENIALRSENERLHNLLLALTAGSSNAPDGTSTTKGPGEP